MSQQVVCLIPAIDSSWAQTQDSQGVGSQCEVRFSQVQGSKRKQKNWDIDYLQSLGNLSW